MTVNNRDVIKIYLQNIFKVLNTYKGRVCDLYIHNKKKIITAVFGVLLLSILAQIIAHPINNYFDEIRKDNLLEKRNKEYARSAVDELVSNIRTVQFYYWCFKKAWTTHGGYNVSAKETYQVFLQNAALESTAIYYVEVQSELNEAYGNFRIVHENLDKIFPAYKKRDENVYVDEKTYLNMMQLMKMSIDKGINVAKIISNKIGYNNHLDKSYIKDGWDTAENLHVNGSDFLKTKHAITTSAESGATMTTIRLFGKP